MGPELPLARGLSLTGLHGRLGISKALVALTPGEVVLPVLVVRLTHPDLPVPPPGAPHRPHGISGRIHPIGRVLVLDLTVQPASVSELGGKVRSGHG